jgi:ABC-type nitrate/sulfonate/bicarbonate transport system permease component
VQALRMRIAAARCGEPPPAEPEGAPPHDHADPQAPAVLSALLIGFFVLWELACLAFGISDLILPRPSQIAGVLVEKMPLLWPHTLQTLSTTLPALRWAWRWASCWAC